MSNPFFLYVLCLTRISPSSNPDLFLHFSFNLFPRLIVARCFSHNLSRFLTHNFLSHSVLCVFLSTKFSTKMCAVIRHSKNGRFHLCLNAFCVEDDDEIVFAEKMRQQKVDLIRLWMSASDRGKNAFVWEESDEKVCSTFVMIKNLCQVHFRPDLNIFTFMY